MQIKPLDRAIYVGKQFTARYQTTGYYDIRVTEDGILLPYVPLEKPAEKSFDDVFFGEWLDHPVAFGAFESDVLIGYVEGAPEGWNNRFRISNICIFDRENRKSGVGSALMAAIEQDAIAVGTRMIVLETQTCNVAAIAFYRKHGFSLIGFDLYSYSNNDPERHEVRIEMGKKL